MMMTEEEAHRKWCPYSKLDADSNAYGSAYGNSIRQVNNGACMGSACMAWRWKQRIINRDEMERAASTFTIATRRLEPIFEDTEHGYCGLAGKP